MKFVFRAIACLISIAVNFSVLYTAYDDHVDDKILAALQPGITPTTTTTTTTPSPTESGTYELEIEGIVSRCEFALLRN